MALADRRDQLDDLVNRAHVFDAIVIGSGYGAGVCAARLAEAGADVCVLERGREFAAGEFPVKLGELAHNVQLENTWFGRGHRLGLFDCYTGADLDVMVGCGLGGTSLINANVMIEPDPRVFAQPVWPTPIRDEAASGRLAGYYARARSVLQPSSYPAGARAPRKLAMMEQHGGTRCTLNVHFAKAGLNSVGVKQNECTHCGDCVTGCNVGAKKTLCFTYLPIAKSYGARIFVQCDVQHVERHGELWEVHFQQLDDGREPIAATTVLRARAVIVGAGVMGTTGILLRSHELGAQLSSELGGRVSGNGDAFAFAYDCDARLDSVGTGRRRDDNNPTGATILSMIYKPDPQDLSKSILIEEGAFPSGTAAGLRRLLELVALASGTGPGPAHWLHGLKPKLLDLLGIRAGDGALNRTLVFLLMGHDGADGVIELDRRGRPKIRWPQLRHRNVFTAENELARSIASQLGGTYVKDPLDTKLFMNNLLTVHPLGGCPMGDGAAGFVDHAGRVLGDDGAIVPGLYVADGSVVPTSLGVNPLWTITALAERIAAHIVVDLGRAPTIDAVKAATAIKPGARVAA
jgi:cholesterol oxidase